MKSEELLQELVDRTNQIIQRVEKLKSEDLQSLTWREDAASWNILECLEHLNLYGDYYLPQIETKIKTTNTQTDREFKSGFLGNYFAKSMLPKEKMTKMKTFKDKNPMNTPLDKGVIDKFLKQQVKLLELLNESRGVSLNKTKIEVSISSLLKFKLGDTFRFHINHIMRHLSQIERIQSKIK